MTRTKMLGAMLFGLAALQNPTASPAAVIGECGARPSLAVQITGFRNRAGQVRVRVFGGSTDTYFDKKRVLIRIERPVPAAGAVTMCVALPRPGTYAVDVRHDVNGNGKTDRSDGGGASGNPKISLFDVLFSRRPDPTQVQITAGAGRTTVPITLKYLQGGSFKPIGGAN